ncbi:kinase-like domain-containing protein [Syncephalis plumigaleata]|nr:kinase-like domain-containing protein [Syncephalis plumigaleata]
MHSDIKPDNILTNERGEVLLIDFDRSIIFGKDLTVRPSGGTAGYVPIDYFNLPYNNQHWKEKNFYAYDAWEFGSTIYSLLMDMPPYGYDRSGEIPRMYNIQEAAKELLSLMNFKKHTCPSLDFPTNTLNSEEKRLAKRLIKWTTKLIAIDPLERLTPIGMLAKL